MLSLRSPAFQCLVALLVFACSGVEDVGSRHQPKTPACGDGRFVVAFTLLSGDPRVRTDHEPARNIRYSVLVGHQCVVNGVTDNNGYFEVRTPEAGDYCVELERQTGSKFIYMGMPARKVEDAQSDKLQWMIFEDEHPQSNVSLRRQPRAFERRCGPWPTDASGLACDPSDPTTVGCKY